MAFDWVKYTEVVHKVHKYDDPEFTEDFFATYEDMPVIDFIEKYGLAEDIDNSTIDEAYAAQHFFDNVGYRLNADYKLFSDVALFFDLNLDFESDYKPEGISGNSYDANEKKYQQMCVYESYKAAEYFDMQKFFDQAITLSILFRRDGFNEACLNFNSEFDILNLIKPLPKIHEYYEMAGADGEQVRENICNLYQAAFAVINVKMCIKGELTRAIFRALPHQQLYMPDSERDLSWVNNNFNANLLPISRLWDAGAKALKCLEDDRDIFALEKFEDDSPKLYRDQFRLIVDGHEYEERINLLSSMIDSDDFVRSRRLDTILMLFKSCIMGDNPRVLEMKLLANMFPFERESIEKFF